MVRYDNKYSKFDSTYNLHGYYKYAEDILNGDVVACEPIIRVCERFEDRFDDDRMYFDEKDVDKRIELIYLMKHSTGEFAHKNFKLLDWQQFAIANIFGWKWKSTGYRVTKDAFLFMTRKNGKTTLAAAIAIASVLGDKEMGAECYCVANSSKQASIALTQIQNFCESLDPNWQVFKQYRSEIKIPKMKSSITTLSSDTMSQDGYNASCFIYDEIHASSTFDQYEVMKSSQGSRSQALAITITTSGFLIGDTYPCYSMWQSSLRVLNGEVEDDTLFPLIYQLDKDDDWRDEKVWKKCCPSLGETVKIDYMRERVAKADVNSSQKPFILTKQFNIWSKDLVAWITNKLLMQYTKPFELTDLNEDEELYSYLGADLSSVADITALSAMVKKNDIFYFKTWYFLPEESLTGNPNESLYRQWSRDGDLLITDGNVVDYDNIIEVMKTIQEDNPILKVAYDSWNSTQWSISCTEQGFPMYPFSQSIGNFNRPVKEFERLIKSGKVIIDKNPITNWMFSNVELKCDMNENAKPVKAGAQKKNKIDGVIGMLEALGAYLSDNYEEPTCEYITNS